jgi:hypothetical protein
VPALRSLCPNLLLTNLHDTVSPAITARPAVLRLQLPRVCEAANEGCVPRKQGRAGPAEGPGTRPEGTEGASSAEGMGLLPPAELASRRDADSCVQRQTVIGQFYQLDRLVVETGISVGYRARNGYEPSLTFGAHRAKKRANMGKWYDKRSKGAYMQRSLSWRGSC